MKDKKAAVEMSYFTEIIRDPSEYGFYRWSHTAWGNCSENCAGGIQTRKTQCERIKDKEIVSDTFCDTGKDRILILTRPIGLPAHAPVAQKIADQRSLIGNSAKKK